MTIFVISAGIGIALFLITLFFGEIFEFFDAFEILPDGFFSSHTIGGFLIGFGAGGILGVSTFDMSRTAGAILGVIIGLVIGALGVTLTKWLKKQEGGAETSINSIVGTRGEVLEGAGANSYASARFRFSGAYEKFNVTASEALKAGDTVTVLETISSSALRVEKVTPEPPFEGNPYN